MSSDTEFGDFNSDDPSVRYLAHQAAKGRRSEAARLMGQSKSPKKAKAARENGKLGGRPPMAGNSKQRRKARRKGAR